MKPRYLMLMKPSNPQTWEDPEVQSAYEEWIVNDPYQDSLGKYEILLRDHYDYEPSIDEVCESKAVQFLNNGEVCCSEKLSYTFVYNPNTRQIESCRFIMLSKYAWLGDVFATLPYGIIKKNRTGIGATTLELNSNRNSIIVVPTRALAYEKAKNSKIDDSNRYSVLYYGGKIKGFSVPTLKEYLADEDIKYKKLLVVADSLERLLSEMGEDCWKKYFIMYDEIDSYQYDSHFRPNLERAFDFFFRFPQSQRCLISATVGTFSHPLIKEEPVIEVTFAEPHNRELSIQPTDNPIISTVNKIKALYSKHPGDNILIAFNLVTRGILPIIKSLPEELQNECSVLCGTKSQPHVEEYLREVWDNKLPSKITFISCTYFVGIDFLERFHLISVCDCNYPFTLLSPAKFQQIAGRCRNHEGLISETIISNFTPNNSIEIDYAQLQNEILEDATSLVDLSKAFHKVKSTFPKMVKSYNEIYLNELIEDSAKSYMGSSATKLVRECNHELAISYFNIDSILIQVKLLHTTYTSPSTLKLELEADDCHVNLLPFEQIEESVSEEVLREISLKKTENDESLRANIIDELRERKNIEDRLALARARRNDATNAVGVFLEHFIELQKYIPFEELIDVLIEHDTPLSFKHLRNATIFWALHPEHPIKLAWKSSFKIGDKYTGRQLVEKTNSIWSGVLGQKVLSHNAALRIAQEYFVELTRTSARLNKNSKPERVYEIISLNPKGLPVKPVESIDKTVNIQRYIKL